MAKSTAQPSNPVKLSLSPFAQMVFDSTSPRFSYPTPAPDTPSPKASDPPQPLLPKTKSSPEPQAKPQAQQVNRVLGNQIAYEENSTITVEAPVKSKKSKVQSQPKSQAITPKETGPSRKSSSIAVVIPPFNPDNHALSQSVALSPSPPAAILPPPKKSSQPRQLSSVVATQLTASQAPATPKHLQPTATTTGSASKIAVVIPGPSPAFNPEEYETLPASPDTPQHLSRKRRRSDVASDDEDSITMDQSEKADLAYRGLRDVLSGIFDAEDQFHADGMMSSALLSYMDNGVSISVSAHAKVESALQKVISVGRFPHVPLDDLIRVQKLSEAALIVAENADVKVDENMGESEIETWLLNVSNAELGLKAARTSLRVMSGGREDKQLYSEDVTQTALSAFKNVMDSCIIPIVEMRSSGTTSSLFKLLTGQRKAITNLLTQCRRLLSLFATLVTSIELSETVVNTLEFTTSRLIFVENAHAEKDSVLGIAKFDSLRVVAMVCAALMLAKSGAMLLIWHSAGCPMPNFPQPASSASRNLRRHSNLPGEASLDQASRSTV